MNINNNPLTTLNDGGLLDISNAQDMSLPAATFEKRVLPADRTMDSWLDKLNRPDDANAFIMSVLNPNIHGDNMDPNRFEDVLSKVTPSLDKFIRENPRSDTKSMLDLIEAIKTDSKTYNQLNNNRIALLPS